MCYRDLLRRKEKKEIETGKEDGRRGLGGGESRGKGGGGSREKGEEEELVTDQISVQNMNTQLSGGMTYLREKSD